jgi:hypothetical protein
MIYCLLRQGLGNQLLQFGAALRLARMDVSQIRFVVKQLEPGPGFRVPDLLPTEILPPVCTDEEFNAALSGGDVVRRVTDPEAGFIRDQSMLDIDYRSVCKTVILDGFFQSGANAAALRTHVHGTHPEWSTVRSRPHAGASKVVAHCRLGDYRRADYQKGIGIINPAYLDRAIAQATGADCAPVDIYTDDEAVKNVYGRSARVTVHVGGNDIEVFGKLMTASTLIIANSTFSLMAAYLSTTVDVLYRPVRWFRAALSDDLSCCFPGKTVFGQNSFIDV